MSQEKVAKYTEQKANRKEIMKKEKRARIFRNAVAAVVLVAVVGWLGYSAVDFYIDNLPRETVDVDYSVVSEYEDQYSDDQTITQY